jgi:hypothetical protein
VKDAWKFLANETSYRNAMEELKDHPRYAWWLKRGLDITPGKGPVGILPTNKASGSMRAWDSLKIARIHMAEHELYNDIGKLRPEFRNLSETDLEDIGKRVASRVNHVTGTLSPNEHGLKSELLFAPALTSSKWQSVIGDIGGAALTLTKGRSAWTPADRTFMSLVARQTAQLFAGHVIAMALNQGYLHLQSSLLGGPVQKVNFTDPSRSDWLAFKAGGYTIQPRGLLEVVQTMGKLAAASGIIKSKTRQTPEEIAGRYGEYKLNPAVSLGIELARGKDLFGRPVPWSGEQFGKTQYGRPDFRKPKYTGTEYALTHGPIFMNEAVKEFYQGLRDHGIDARSATAIVRGISQNPKIVREAAIEGAGAFVGLGIHKDYYQQRDAASR